MTSADFTIRDVLDWARTKPADERYDYHSTTACALCQFIRETGRAINPSVGGQSWQEWLGSKPYDGRQGEARKIHDDLVAPLLAGTFGSLAARLEALCPETPVTQNNWQNIDAYLTDIEDVARERVSA